MQKITAAVAGRVRCAPTNWLWSSKHVKDQFGDWAGEWLREIEAA
jgi:hypothetical protein